LLVHLHPINQLEHQVQILVVDILLVVVLVEHKDQLDLLVVKAVVLMVEIVGKMLQVIPFKVLPLLEVVEVAVDLLVDVEPPVVLEL
tara:strand:- start:431 stop:691 length:261 start_codon:yes stop_codon:yes gene_type:complete